MAKADSKRAKKIKISKKAAAKYLRERGIKLPWFLLRDDEPFIRSVANTLTRKDIVIDLGAHTGIASIEFAHRAGKVYAFEPHPEIFRRLTEIARSYPRIEPINKAASDENGTAQLFYEPRLGNPDLFCEGSTLATGKTNLTYNNAYDVDVVRLADFILDLGQPVRMIKMDIEGAEYQVIADLIETPAIHQVGMVYVEDHCDRVTGLAEERDRVLARIKELGLTERFDFGWP